MTDTAKEKFDKAKLIDANSADSERLKFLYAWEIRKDPEAIEAAETAWRRTTIQPYIKGFRLILDAAMEDQWFGNTIRAQDDYLMLGQHDAAPFLSELMSGELELWRVIETVKAIKTPKARAKKPNELHKVIHALLDYRRRNTMNFQLEKLDDYLNELRRLVDP
jgi:hypothetical protein